jgi:NOL1/NOP2/fmu family ribosome biogenesis protein
MKNLKILNTREVKEILNILKKQFGYSEKPDYCWLISPKQKVYIVNSDINKIDLNSVRIDSIGLYFGEYKDKKFRLSLEGSMLIGDKLKKNVVELNVNERNQWLKGEDLIKDLGEEARFIVLKNKDDIIGCGRYKEGRVFNYMPKERRLRVIAN